MSLLLALKSRYKELTGEDLGGGAGKKKGKGKPEVSADKGKGKMADKGKTDMGKVDKGKTDMGKVDKGKAEEKKKVESAGAGGEGPGVKHKTRYLPPSLTHSLTHSLCSVSHCSSLSNFPPSTPPPSQVGSGGPKGGEPQ